MTDDKRTIHGRLMVTFAVRESGECLMMLSRDFGQRGQRFGHLDASRRYADESGAKRAARRHLTALRDEIDAYLRGDEADRRGR